MESTVRELPRAAQLDRKAKLDAGLVDTVFQVGDQVMLRTKELLDVADIGKLRPPWEGPFEVTAKPSPNAYTLALPARICCAAGPSVSTASRRTTRGRNPQNLDFVFRVTVCSEERRSIGINQSCGGAERFTDQVSDRSQLFGSVSAHVRDGW